MGRLCICKHQIYRLPLNGTPSFRWHRFLVVRVTTLWALTKEDVSTSTDSNVCFFLPLCLKEMGLSHFGTGLEYDSCSGATWLVSMILHYVITVGSSVLNYQYLLFYFIFISSSQEMCVNAHGLQTLSGGKLRNIWHPLLNYPSINFELLMIGLLNCHPPSKSCSNAPFLPPPPPPYTHPSRNLNYRHLNGPNTYCACIRSAWIRSLYIAALTGSHALLRDWSIPGVCC